MNIDETVKALRDRLTPNGAITLDADGVGYILDMIERMGNLVEKYECEVIPDYHKLCEQLQAENERLKSKHESKDDCIYYIRNEAGYCKSEKRNSVYCTGVDCGFRKCIEEE
ncbi:hypothetical protein [Anaerotignum sp. MB30-C6]|uniref:hypothetical protein n=1 Tax=Anaerotignum sp. MB30-C6 TaxID=3070814 RepID=UPI0027DCE3AE|nr:hypothetical protein [Anaerotignum sp. MB30-C6]WMI81919.1 hypothetical protein RBQ60_04095 [Anaerotignum sp. MB30-C6]